MDKHTLKVLEYYDLLSHLSGFAQSQPAKEAAKDLAPCTKRADVTAALALTQEALKVLEDGLPDLAGVVDTRPVIGRLAMRGAILDAQAVLELYSVQLGVRAARGAVKDRASALPGLSGLVSQMNPLPAWEKLVRRSLDEDGQVQDSASSELAAVRKEQISCRRSLLSKLEEFITKPSIGKVLRENYVTQRNDRYVVPVKPEYHRAFSGVVQDTSQSGQTLFIEPLFVVEKNNRLAKLRGQEEDEIRKIMKFISEEARGYRESMALNLDLVVEFDLIFAKGRLGLQVDGAVPEVSPDTARLSRAKHPLLLLLEGGGCVPIDMELGDQVTTLVITGPNTGGKTVALKTLGLITLMAQTGIPVPVGEDSRIRVFKKIFADIGDEQSLAQSLSTFSSHMSVVSEILSEADDQTLALLDEMGAGTDPQEGSALGIAILEHLRRCGAWTVVTTHHNLLKEFAYNAEYAENASVVFDAATLKPVFELRMGAPGRSYALEIAARLGLAEEVTARARQIMGPEGAGVDDLLGRLSVEIEKESAARRRVENARDAIETDQERLRKVQVQVLEELKEEQSRSRREAMALIRQIKQQGKKLLREARDAGTEGEKVFNREIDAMAADAAEKIPLPPRKRGAGGPVTIGDLVEVVPLGAEGTVVSVFSGGEDAEVVSGGIRMKAAVSDLTPLGVTREKGRQGKDSLAVGYTGSREAPGEISLLGFTVPEALAQVDTVLDRMMLGPGSTLRIIHGKGTGALREAITESLRQDPRVISSRAGGMKEGGSGVTIVRVKE